VKLAFVTPRYGADIASGPEHVCRLLAEHISKRHDVDVITTCAQDARGSRNDYPEGPDRVRGVRIRRFPLSARRSPTTTPLDRLVNEPHGREDELEWVRQSSPWSTALVEHLKNQHHTYDAVVFFSMTAATTVFGLPVAQERAVLVPYVQLDPSLRFSLWSQVLSAPRAIGLVSATERRLITDYLRAGIVHDELVGIGIERPPQASYPRHQQDPDDTLANDDDPAATDEDTVPVFEGPGIPFRRRHRLYGSFALFGGRMEPGNGCQEMLDYFDTFAASMETPPSLVLMGMKMMRVPDAPYLRHAGVLPDRERMLAFEAADLTIAPASEDLLAESVLESFAVGTPVVASARNAAAVEHCSKAHAGLYYENRDEFVECVRLLATDGELRRKLGESGRQYIDQHYRWDAVVARLEHLLGRIRGRSAA